LIPFKKGDIINEQIFYKNWIGYPGKIFFEKFFLPSCRAPQNASNKRARFFFKCLFLKI